MGIVSPVPIELHIDFNEVTNQAAFKMTRNGKPVDMPLPIVVGIFCQVLIALSGQAMAAFQAQFPPRNPPGNPGGNPNGKIGA